MENNVVVSDYAAMDRLLREERKHILGLCKKIKKSGANVVLIQKSILRDAYNELSLHFLAKMDILVVTDIERNDVEFISRTLGCQPIAHADSCSADKLGFAAKVGEVSIAGSGHKVVKMTGVKVRLRRTTTESEPPLKNKPPPPRPSDFRRDTRANSMPVVHARCSHRRPPLFTPPPPFVHACVCPPPLSPPALRIPERP